MGKALSSVKEYAVIAFTLLGVLFGMMIMSFIFGVLGPSSINVISDSTSTVNNLTNAYINTTVFTIPEAAFSNYSGSFNLIQARNATSLEIILVGNYTVDSAAGTVTSATARVWNNATLTYTVNQKTQQEMSSIGVQNNSLNAINTYSSGSSSQFSILSIAIIIVLLIGVFLLFWKIFVSDKKKRNSDIGGNFA